MFRKACEMGAEGIVSKRAGAPYQTGRSRAWLKSKCVLQQEFVVGGFTELSNGGHGVGSLLLGYYTQGKLIYAGRTGTGFTRKTHELLRDRLDALRQSEDPVRQSARRGEKGRPLGQTHRRRRSPLRHLDRRQPRPPGRLPRPPRRQTRERGRPRNRSA